MLKRGSLHGDGTCTVMGVTALLLGLAAFASFLFLQIADVPDVCFADVIVPPPKDAREYRYVELDNGLRALVVSDATADAAAASLAVGVGSISDPLDTPGLAHFLEHMLFTGNARYPREGEYFEFLNARGGMANAATGPDVTHYHFSIPAEHLLPALDRLLEFFISPTLDPSMAEREKHAVSAEHAKNVQDDQWRFQRLRWLTTGQPGCALGKFMTGNLLTLANASTAELRAFYDAHYVPSRMALVVVGRESADALEAHVRAAAGRIPRGTAAVAAAAATADERAVRPGPLAPDPSRGLAAGDVEPATGAAVGGRLIEFQTVADASVLCLVWYLPVALADADTGSKSLRYVTKILGDEGSGSLVSLLRARRGWIDELVVAAERTSSLSLELSISVALTEAGGEHVAEIVRLLLAQIRQIARTPAERWRWDEDRTLAELEWRLLEPPPAGELAEGLSELLVEGTVPLCEAMRQPFAYRVFDPAQIAAIAASLSVDRLFIYHGSQSLFAGQPAAQGEPLVGAVAYGGGGDDGSNASGATNESGWATESGWQLEPYYGLKFQIRPFNDAELADWERPEGADGAEALRLPARNPFIPTDFSILTPAPSRDEDRLRPPVVAPDARAPSFAPELLASDPAGRLWLYADSEFGQPRTAVQCTITTGAAFSSARALWAAQLLISMASDALKESAYPAAVVGMSAAVGIGVEGLELSVSGYSDRLMALLRLVASLAAPSADAAATARFAPIKAEIVRGLAAERYAGSLANGLNWIKLLTRTQTRFYDHAAALPLVEALSLDDVRVTAADLLAVGVYTECLVAGNARAAEARAIRDALSGALGGPPLAAATLAGLRQRVLSVPVGAHLLELEATDPAELNSAALLYYEVGSTASGLREEALLELLVTLVHQPVFDALRTTEQLGYTLGVQPYRAWSAQAILLYARSDSAPAGYLDERFRGFLRAHAAALGNTSAAAFELTRDALVHNLGARDRSLSERATRMWAEIEMHDCAFDRSARLQDEARTLTLDEVVELYTRVFLNPRTRRELAIWVKAPGEEARPTPKRSPRTDARAGYAVIAPDAIEAWRARCALLPAPTACAAFSAEPGKAPPPTLPGQLNGTAGGAKQIVNGTAVGGAKAVRAAAAAGRRTNANV